MMQTMYAVITQLVLATAECTNDTAGNGVDTGCSSRLPICDAGDGAYGAECGSKCIGLVLSIALSSVAASDLGRVDS